MEKGKKILSIIPARGGSKGIHRKNIRPIAGKPLLAWTNDEAKKSKYIDRAIVSTDDDEIINIGMKWGCDIPFSRPVELAQDKTPAIEVILHAIEQLPEFDYIVLLQPTSPLRTVTDIDKCIEECLKSDAPACVTVTETDKSPYWMYSMNEQNKMRPFIKNSELITRRQDLPRLYALNGAVYFAQTDWIKKNQTFITEETIAYTMPKERSFDIDTEIDFQMCEFMMSKK